MLKLLVYLKKHIPLILVSVVLIYIQVMTNLNLPRLMSDIINKGVLTNDIPLIWKTGGIMLLYTVISSAAVILAGFFISRIAASVAVDLREALFRRLTYASIEQMGNFGTATLVTRTTNDINQVQQLITMSRMLLMAPLMGIGGIIMAIDQAPSLSWVILVIMGLLFLIMGVTMAFALPQFKVLQKKLDQLNLVLREFLTGLRVIKAFNKSTIERERFREANGSLTATTLRVTRIMVFLIPSMMFIMNASALLILWVGGHQIQSSGVEIGSIMAFMQYVMQILMSFLMLAMVFTMIPRAQVSAKRINEVLDSKNTVTNLPGTLPAPTDTISVEFREASFRYAGAETPVLKDISFKAESGKITAIIGGTGSGKSTLIDLIPRFYDLDEGELLIDGMDIKRYALKELRQKIALVPQKAVIFSGTMADNIRYGKGDATDEEVVRAARIAQAEEFILGMENGFDGAVAQGGTNISGGQKQRLSIARAIARDPEIFIFDDSFSALDYTTDAKLRKALRENLKNKLIFIVAQRVSTIMDADQIIVLDKGRIVGIGTHKNLFENNPIYREIVLSQMEEGEAA